MTGVQTCALPILLAEILRDNNIHATETEMMVLIEAAVAEFNEAFKKPSVPEAGEGGEGK